MSSARVANSHGNIESLFPQRYREVSLVRLERSHSTDIMLLCERSKVVSWVRVANSHGNIASWFPFKSIEVRLLRFERLHSTDCMLLFERSNKVS